MAKQQTTLHDEVAPLEDGGKRGIADQQQSESFAGSAEQTAKRLEELERRLLAREKALDLKQASLDQSQKEDIATIGQRLSDMQSAMPGGRLSRVGSGTIHRVEKGEFIAYDCMLAAGTNVQGGWIKAPNGSETKVTARLNRVSIAMEPFSYDPKFGCPYHQVKHQPYKVFFTDPERDQVVGPPHLVDVSPAVRRVRGLLAVAG